MGLACSEAWCPIDGAGKILFELRGITIGDLNDLLPLRQYISARPSIHRRIYTGVRTRWLKEWLDLASTDIPRHAQV